MARKIKKRLTQAEEFEILKMVFDKFLWLGVGILAYGFYSLVTGKFLQEGVSFIIAGAIVLIIFISLLVREYEVLR
jgi:Mg/Co/Ni transporter MgtE